MFSGTGCLQIASNTRELFKVVKDSWDWKREGKRNSQVPPVCEVSAFTTIILCSIFHLAIQKQESGPVVLLSESVLLTLAFQCGVGLSDSL